MRDTDCMAKLTDLTVEWISLVKRPANGRGVILKALDSRGGGVRLLKADSQLHRVYGIVYAPDDVDAHGDYADAETIRKAADAFMREARARAVDVEHGFEPVPAFVAESWIVRSGDPIFADEKPGAWAVGIQVEDEALWQEIASGAVEGLSLAGTARIASSKRFFHRFFQKERDMTHDEVRAIVREVLDETVKAAQAEDDREAMAELKKAVTEKESEIETLKKSLAEKDKTLSELDARLSRLEAQGKGAGGGEPAPDVGAHFI